MPKLKPDTLALVNEMRATAEHMQARAARVALVRPHSSDILEWRLAADLVRKLANSMNAGDHGRIGGPLDNEVEFPVDLRIAAEKAPMKPEATRALTGPQRSYLTEIIDTYVHGSTAIMGRGAKRVALSLDKFKLAAYLDTASDNEAGPYDEIQITDAGIEWLVAHANELTAVQQAQLKNVMESARRASRPRDQGAA